MEKKVEKVTRAELDSIVLGNESSPKADFSVAKNNIPNEEELSVNHKSINNLRTGIKHNDYVKKLKDDEIKKWFEPFGYVLHKFESGFLIVICKDIACLLNDYELILKNLNDPNDYSTDAIIKDEELNKIMFAKSKFNFSNFVKACDEMDIDSSQALEEYVAIKLSERFPSYSAERKKYKDDKTKQALKDYEKTGADKKLVELMSEIKDRQDMVHEVTHNRGYYGTYKPE